MAPFLNKRKIINDPVYGFIGMPSELIFDLVEHPYFQRLRRIKQLGLTHLVYPGALHTRFHHSLGAMYLTTKAIQVLRSKKNVIDESEAEAVYIAILLHDIGHGPFSHALERTIVDGLSHESLSIIFIEKLNQIFDGRLEKALAIFKDKHPRKFLHKLVSSQLDMDRMDYLKRDSFFTGVSEGAINTERLIDMLEVTKDQELGIAAKGLYSAEKFLVARRLMYWQVYLHKTVLSAEYMLLKILQRARELVLAGNKVSAGPVFGFFLDKHLSEKDFRTNPEPLNQFSKLDDIDVFSSIKNWQYHSDPVLSNLSNWLVNRQLFRVIIQKEKFTDEHLEKLRKQAMAKYNISLEESKYYVFVEKTSNYAYHPKMSQINIVHKDGTVEGLQDASEQLNISVLQKPMTKHFICYPKSLEVLPFK